ncbi:MAG: hypothetical protein RL234_380, partial [Pseudomonadota bacterium]
TRSGHGSPGVGQRQGKSKPETRTKPIYTEHERWERLLGVQQRLVILLPDSLEEVRDRGLIFAQLEYLRPAIEDMQTYLSGQPDASDAEEIREHISTLENQVRQH